MNTGGVGVGVPVKDGTCFPRRDTHWTTTRRQLEKRFAPESHACLWRWGLTKNSQKQDEPSTSEVRPHL